MIEEQVVNEIVKILRSPEILVHVNKLAEENHEINREDVLIAVKNLNEAWSYLYPNEQRKILDILVGSIQVKDGGVKMKLNLDGLNRLLFEVA